MNSPPTAGKDGDQQRHLESDGSGVCVDPDDLGLHVERADRRAARRAAVFVITSASCSRAVETCCCSAGSSTLLFSAMCVKATDRVANMIAPANASPKESPNDPAAELTPAASLTRSSVIGDSVHLFSCETNSPSPDPAMMSGMTRYQPEDARGTSSHQDNRADRRAGRSPTG